MQEQCSLKKVTNS